MEQINYLEKMYECQKELLKGYMVIEKLPSYPINIDSKSGVQLLKSFAYRFINELGEMFDDYAQIFYSATQNLNNETLMKHHNEMVNELGDAWCFMIELMIYANIGPWELRKACTEQIYNNEGESDYEPLVNSELEALVLMGQQLNIQYGSNLDDRLAFTYGGHYYISATHVSRVAEYCWHISFSLMKSLNLLKNKEWNQSETQASISGFHDNFSKSFLVFMQLLSYIHLTPETIFKAYDYAYNKNKNRIQNGY